MNEVSTLVNGVPVDRIGVFDRGFQYGDGVFETVAIYRGTPLLWEQHLARLRRGADRLMIAPPSEAQLGDEVRRLCANAARAVLKIIVTRGASGRGYAVHAVGEPTRVVQRLPWPDYPAEFAHAGVSLHVCETILSRNPRLAGIKHLNRLEQVLARAEWRNEYADGIMCDEHGDVIEGTMSNLFVVVDGSTLHTPDLSACGVEGVMRDAVLAAARRLDVPTEIGRVTSVDLDNANEMFITNSLIGVWPVRQLRNREYTVGPITRKIQQAIREAHCFDRA